MLATSLNGTCVTPFGPCVPTRIFWIASALRPRNNPAKIKAAIADTRAAARSDRRSAAVRRLTRRQ